MALGIANNIGDNKEHFLRCGVLKAPTTCLDLDGTNDYYYSSGPGSIDIEKGFSMTACVKIDSVSTYDTIVGWDKFLSGTSKACALTVGGSYIQWNILSGTSVGWDDDGFGKRTTSTVSDDTWYHLVGTGKYDATADSWDVDFWLNGVKQTGSWSHSGYAANEFTTSTKGTIGNWNNTSGEPRWGGRINMIGLYQGVLPDSAIAYLYNGGTPRSPLHYRTLLGTNATRNFWPYTMVDKDIWYYPGTDVNLTTNFPESGSSTWLFKNTGTVQSDYMGS